MDSSSGSQPEPVNDSASPAEHRIPRHKYNELQRALAVGEVKRSVLAKRYGVSGAAITQFAKRYAWEIDQIRAHLDDAYAGMWIASKENRIAAYQGEYDASLANEFYSDHYEHVKTRALLLKSVAEELGQLPNKSQLTVGGVVRHELVGIDVDECFPDALGESEEGPHGASPSV